MTYWIKPIGSSDHPIDPNQAWSALHQEQHFAKRPISVSPGDIFITYAVGHHIIEGLYKVVGNVFREANTADKAKEPWRERYPYIWDTENILPAFSKNWSIHQLNLWKLETQFKPKGRITPTPSNSLNYIKRGPDKVRITEEFTQYIIAEMKKHIAHLNAIQKH